MSQRAGMEKEREAMKKRVKELLEERKDMQAEIKYLKQTQGEVEC